MRKTVTVEEQRIQIIELFKQGKTYREIEDITGVDYSLVYYHLKANNLVVQKNVLVKQKRSHFNYLEYMEALKDHCCKIRGCTRKELKEYTQTNEGQNFLLREGAIYTPSVYKGIKEDL